MPCCDCQSIAVIMEVTWSSVTVDVCGYAKFDGFGNVIGIYKDLTDEYSTGGSCVYPSGEGLILSGGTCSTGAPSCSGDTSGFIIANTFTNLISGGFAFASSHLTTGSITEYEILTSSRPSWYLLSDPFAADLDVLNMLINPGAAASDVFDDINFPCSMNSASIRFRSAAYPVDFTIELERYKFDRTSFAELARDTVSVTVPGNGDWSAPTVLTPTAANMGVAIDLSRVFMPGVA